MAERDEVVNDRTFWTWTGSDGKTRSGDTPPGGPDRPFGIGSAAPAATQYREVTYGDGRKILAHFDPAANDWTQDSVTYDRGIQAQYNHDHPAAAKPADATKGPALHTFPDGSQGHWDPAANGGRGDWVIDFTKPQGPAVPKPEQVSAPPTQEWIVSVDQYGAETRTKNPNYQAKPGTAPALNLPASRPGQLTDLGLVEAQANQFIAAVNADQDLTPQRRQQQIQTYLETVVKPAAEQATREANEHAAQQTRRQQEADARAQQQQDRLTRAEERQTATAERQTRVAEGQLDLARRKYGYDAGQAAVSNALKLLPYSVGPTFGAEFAAGLGTLAGGGGPISVSPSSLVFNAPDFDALRDYHVEQALAPLRGASSMQAASVPGAAPAQPPPPTDPLAGVPLTPRPPYPQPGGTGIVGRFGQ